MFCLTDDGTIWFAIETDVLLLRLQRMNSYRPDRERILFLINKVLAVINVDGMIKNNERYRASKSLHEVVTPQAVALGFLWIKHWVKFEEDKLAKKTSKASQERSETSSDMSSLTDNGADATTKRQGRVKGNPSYLTAESKKDYRETFAVVMANYKNEERRKKWNDWWKRRMARVISDKERSKNKNGKKRKRTSEEEAPSLPTGLEVTQLMAV